jgi:hypothetical protein
MSLLTEGKHWLESAYMRWMKARRNSLKNVTLESIFELTELIRGVAIELEEHGYQAEAKKARRLAECIDNIIQDGLERIGGQ